MLPLTVLIITFVALFAVNKMDPINVCKCRIVRSYHYQRTCKPNEYQVIHRRYMKMCDGCKSGEKCQRS